MSISCFQLISVRSFSKNCDVNFSCVGCLVYEHMFWKMTTKGPKVRILSRLQFIFNYLSNACNAVSNSFENRHIKFSHPNFTILSHLFKKIMFRNKNVFSNAFVSCSLSKLAKSRALTFSSYAHHASTFFKMTW